MVCYLIDDDPDDQEFFAMALEDVNPAIELHTADNGVEAIEKLSSRFSPGVIFLDLNMPRIDGWECLQRIREMAHLKQTPVIIYSTSESALRPHNRSHYAAFLTKQSKISDLSKKLNEVFKTILARPYADKG